VSEVKEQTAEVKSYLLALGVFLLALTGLSSMFVVGYTSNIPREAFLVFGRHLSLAIGLEAGFSAAFSLITAKAMLILISIMIALGGGILSAFKNEMLKHAAKKMDEVAIRIATAPLKVVLLLATGVFWARFVHFSFDGFMIAGGWLLFGWILLKTSDRVLLRKLIGTAGENANTEIENHLSVRLLLLATLISLFAYSAGISAERQAKRQETRILSEKLDQPGIVFGAGDIGLLVFIPGELIETPAGGFLEKRKPSTWYLLPFNGDPLELR